MSKLKGGSGKPEGQSKEGNKGLMPVPKGLKPPSEPPRNTEDDSWMDETEPPLSMADGHSDTLVKPSEEYDNDFAEEAVRSRRHQDLDWLKDVFKDEGYEEIQMLGAGGMGEVFKARYTGNPHALGLPEDGVVAIKLVSPQYSGDEEAEKRFRQEANIVINLKHPNIVRMFLHATVCRRPYLVMEYLKGTDLHTIVYDKARTLDTIGTGRALKIARDACSALALAHSRGIIHRDIKPENIFIVKEGDAEVVKLIDLGLAKLAESEGMTGPKRTQTGHYSGTPQYMAPELIPDESGKPVFDKRIDIFSIGVSLYEMLTGSLPFQAGHLFGIIMQLKSEDPPEAPQQRRADLDIPDDVNALVMKCLEKDPNKRYQSMEELIQAIDACGLSPGEGKLLDGIKTLKAVSPKPQRDLRPLRWVLPLFLGSVLAAGAVAYYKLAGRHEPEAAPATQPAAAQVYHAKIKTDIAGADVFMEEKLDTGTLIARPLGKTPLEVPLEGEQTIYLELEGYRRAYLKVSPANPSVSHIMVRRD